MKNVDALIESAADLAASGRSAGEIADELNVSRATASWLVDQSNIDHPDTESTATHSDIHVDWQTIGADSVRLTHVGAVLADLLTTHGQPELIVGIEKAGVPLATTVAQELDAGLATYAPRKHRQPDQTNVGGTFSRNFATIEDAAVAVVDDTITSGTTMAETIEAVHDAGGTPIAGAVLVDKRGVETLATIPIASLLQVIPVDGR